MLTNGTISSVLACAAIVLVAHCREHGPVHLDLLWFKLCILLIWEAREVAETILGVGSTGKKDFNGPACKFEFSNVSTIGLLALDQSRKSSLCYSVQ